MMLNYPVRRASLSSAFYVNPVGRPISGERGQIRDIEKNAGFNYGSVKIIPSSRSVSYPVIAGLKSVGLKTPGWPRGRRRVFFIPIISILFMMGHIFIRRGVS
jgi:hypothetical protein